MNLNILKVNLPVWVSRRLSPVGIACVMLAAPLAAATSRVYVTNHAGRTISVVDTATNKVVQELKDVEVPEAVDFSADGKTVFVSTGAEDFLRVLDRKTGKLIKKVPLSGHANDLAVTPDGKLVVVCIGQVPGGLDLFDAKNFELVKTIPAETRLHDLVITPDSKYAITTSPNGKFVRVFDLQAQQMAWEVKMDQGTLVPAVETSADGSPKRIFVQLTSTKGFAVIDFATRKEVARIQFPANEPAMPSSGPPSHGIGIAPDGKSLWVSAGVYDSVFAYSLPDLALLGQVRLPQVEIPGQASVNGVPEWIAFTPDSMRVYVTNEGDRSVSAIDMKTMKVIARIPVGEAPGRMNTLVLR